MSFDTLTNAMYTQFKNDVYMLARQQNSIYLPRVDVVQVGGKPGERVVFQRLGEIAVNEVTDRYQELEAATLPHSARSLTLRHYHTHVTIDTLDDMRMVYDPSGPYVQAMAAAIGKKMDDIIRAALIGNADNKDGTSTTAATAATDLGTAITIDELVGIRKDFNQAFVMPGEPITIMLDQYGYVDIMQLNNVISQDYNNRKPLVDGTIGQFLGMDFVYDVNMPLYAVADAQLIGFTRRALKVALPMDIKVSMDRIPERRNSMLLQAEFVMGAVRMEENQVVWRYVDAA